MKNKLVLTVGLFLMFVFYATAQSPGVTIVDAKHYSNVFGEIRNYRIFLPPGYYDNVQKKYPVIYFLHGWSQRYFGNAGQGVDGFDKGNENNGDNIANFVSAHEVILVKSDGYNREVNENYYLRPYNIGPVETSRQFPIYYPELIEYIDSHYRTIADREHRAISGLSMGGFMTFWIGGKYPDLFSAAGNFCGSAEFIVGPKNFPIEYRHIDMYKNYAGMNVRLNYGDKDFIRGYHQDMNRIWPQLMDNYEYKIYNAAHSTCGLGEMFGFFLKTFEHPPARPSRWDHTDVYPDFSVWGYQVSSDRNLPGFTILENVDKKGFRCSVREFLPDGALMPYVNVSVTTSPVYEKNVSYVINDIDTRNFNILRDTIYSDSSGKIQILLNGSSHEIGISKMTDRPKPNICIATVEVKNMQWVTIGKDVAVSIKLLNKGTALGKSISARLSATRSDAHIQKGESSFGDITISETKSCQNPFVFRIENDSMEIARFKLTVRDESNNEWVDFFEIPLKKDVPEIKDFKIADGKIFTVAKGGIDNETVFLGSGNGDGVANPGESIVLLVKDQNKYWRTNLSFSDKYVNPFGVNTRMSDDWSSFDHVGASAKYAVPLIFSDCPENHSIDFFAEYWLPEYPLHVIKQGIIKVEVKGKDNTTPKINWVRVNGDNVVQVNLYDGSKIKYVKARLINRDDPEKSFEVELKDDGVGEDRAETDNVFSKKTPVEKFGIYRMVVEATDSFGNKALQEVTDTYILH